jgi:hypothetical protein
MLSVIMQSVIRLNAAAPQIWPWSKIGFMIEFQVNIRGLYYKTFYNHYLWTFVII